MIIVAVYALDTGFFSTHSVFLTAEIRMKGRNDVMCCVFAVTFASEAEPQLFLACS